jgi:hypothetical protein
MVLPFKITSSLVAHATIFRPPNELQLCIALAQSLFMRDKF